jgi:hypothetical protein
MYALGLTTHSAVLVFKPGEEDWMCHTWTAHGSELTEMHPEHALADEHRAIGMWARDHVWRYIADGESADAVVIPDDTPMLIRTFLAVGARNAYSTASLNDSIPLQQAYALASHNERRYTDANAAHEWHEDVALRVASTTMWPLEPHQPLTFP